MTTKPMRQKDAEKIEAARELRKLLRPGQKVYTVLRHVSSSGMTRHIDLYTIRRGELRFLSGYVGRLLGYRRAKDQGLVVGGCGMDMGFHLVYELGRALFPKGFTPAKCGQTWGRNGSDPNELDPDGGYALRHDWL